ncbi:MAG: glycoside hydrolase family 32 protein [Candidatus Sumerlaeota bacterium]
MLREIDNSPGAKAMSALEKARVTAETDPSRPVFHFVPVANWINDPNGTIFHEGYHHVFYQHHPYSPEWAMMHWGHARSRDLLHWEHLPIALVPETDKGERHCFSGTCVVDDDGTPTILYTSIHEEGPYQWAAVSEDWLQWQRVEGNPVMDKAKLHTGAKIEDWRDPFVFKKDGKWYCVIGGHEEGQPGCAFLYSADRLDEWEYVGVLSRGDERNWECPNFFPLDGKWVLLYAPHNPVRYQIGEWDGATDYHLLQCGPVDASKCYYATNISRTRDDRVLMWGWVRFARGNGWAGALALPRELSLDHNNALLMRPARELKALRSDPEQWADLALERDKALTFNTDALDVCEMEIRLECCEAEQFTLTLHSEQEGLDAFEIVIDLKNRQVTISDYPMECPGLGRSVHLRLFIDKSIVEVFVDERYCLTGCLDYAKRHLSIVPKGGDARIAHATYWPMDSFQYTDWKAAEPE